MKTNRKLLTTVMLVFAALVVLCAGCVKRIPEATTTDGAVVVNKSEFVKLAGVKPDTGSAKTGVRADVIYPGDVVGLTIYERLPVSQDKRQDVRRVGDDSTIFVVPMGSVKVAGLALGEAERAVEASMAATVVSPHVEMEFMKRAYEPRYFVFGETGKQGVIPLKAGDRLLDAISNAGGVKADAYRRSIKLIRVNGDQVSMVSIDLYDLMSNGRLDLNLPMCDQDVIFVPRRFLTNFGEVMGVLGGVLPWYYFVKNF